MKTRHILQETARSIARNRTAFMLSTSVQAVCLTLLTVFFIVTLNLNAVVRAAGRKVEIHAFLAEDANVQSLIARVDLIDGVQSTRFVSKGEALEELRADLGQDASVINALDENPLPASIRIVLGSGFAAFDRLEEIEHKVSLLPGVTEVWSGRESLEKLDRILRAAIALGIGILIIVAVSITFIAFQTAETSIMSRRREIDIMELVGATRSAVQAPFLLEGTFQGLLGGIAAFLVALVLDLAAKALLPAPVFPVLPVLAFALILGGVLGLLGSSIAFGRTRK
ncbi:MAG: hypothetical protein JSU73_11950 [candidate division WOR-3 bacterium]|nr:MAG: hypothetical protein JSU73_11950 [candidate division WOR-3 bacterium]